LTVPVAPDAAPNKLTLRQLGNTRRAAALLQRVVEAAPRFAQLLSGASPGPHEGEEILSLLPEGKTADEKFVYAVELEGVCIGCVDLIRDYPDTNTAHIGLLLLAQAYEGCGLGSASLAHIEALVRTWPECSRLRVGIVERNARALAFWTRHGFVPTGESKPYGVDPIGSRVLIYAKPLA
jgi:diamine N-acetyltransferase